MFWPVDRLNTTPPGKDRYRSPGIHTYNVASIKPFSAPAGLRAFLANSRTCPSIRRDRTPACTMPFSTSGSLSRPSPLRPVVEPIAKRSGTGNLRTAVQSYWIDWFSRAWETRREYPRSARRRSRPFGSMGCVSSCPEPQFLAS